MADEFERIARLFRPLTEGAPEAFGLLDDAAAIPSRPGFDLIVTKDAIVEGVHFLAGDPPGTVAKKLLRANLSDLAAKGAEPYAYFLAVAWPPHWDEAARAAFAAGLGEDQRRYGIRLFGGDTTSTPGPLTASVTALGWVPAGGMIRRGGAAAGDRLLVSGTIGDAALGLEAARGGIAGATDEANRYLADHYRLPEPRLGVREALRAAATAAADVSDGLIADAGHIATASGVALEIDLDRLPLSEAAAAWLGTRPDRTAALVRLATGGDDYEIVCTARTDAAATLVGAGFTEIGRAAAGQGVRVLAGGVEVRVDRPGWRHE
jgi:thiamine-monophosphate kinase